MAESIAAQALNRLPELLDTTYKKIEELRNILAEESRMVNFDFTQEIKPIERRQEELAEKVSLVTSRFYRNTDKSSTHQQSYTRGRSLTVGCRNITFDSNQSGIQNRTKAVSGIDVRDGKQAQNLGGVAKENVEVSPKVNQVPPKDMSWYGSLDRNLAKKKKRGSPDKHRRHTKVIGSLATLERADNLQPDEQYEIGLPLGIANISVKSLHSHRQDVPQFSQGHDLFHSGPALPPKPIAAVKFDPGRMVHSQPKISLLESNHNHMVYPHPYISSLPMPHHTPLAQMDTLIYPQDQDKEIFVGSSKGWFETALDETSSTGKQSTSNKLDTISTNSFDMSSSLDMGDSASMKVRIPSPSGTMSEKSSKSSDCSESKVGISNEISKPFEMSDYFKYSQKYRPPPSQRSSNEIKRILATQFQNSPAPKPSDSFDSNGNDMEAPKLPPKQKMKSDTFKSDPAYLDEEVAWVMDTPTIV